jgi:ankyrin repeat protein
MWKDFNNQQLEWQKRINDQVPQAVRDGLIYKIPDVNKVDNCGFTCLQVAIKRNNVDFVKFVLSQGADLRDSTHLEYAIKNFDQCNNQITKLLLEYGANSNAKNGFGHSMLHIALYYKNISAVRLLIEFGADVNVPCPLGFTPFFIACRDGNLESVQIIGATCEAKHITEYSGFHMEMPIEIAARRGFVDIVEYLITVLKSPVGKSFYRAVDFGWMDIVDFFLARKTDLNLNLDDVEKNPLRTACIKRNIDMVDRLLQENVNLIRNEGYASHIIIAILVNSLDIVMRMVSYGDDYQYQDIYGMTALGYACKLGRLDIVNFLLGLSVELNCVNNEGNSALILACQGKYHDIVKVLVNVGCDISIINAAGQKAIDYVTDNQIRELFV